MNILVYFLLIQQLETKQETTTRNRDVPLSWLFYKYAKRVFKFVFNEIKILHIREEIYVPIKLILWRFVFFIKLVAKLEKAIAFN